MQWWTAQQLKSKNPQARIDAIAKMVSWPVADSLPLLLKMLGDPEAGVRKAAIQSLAALENPPSTEGLVALLTGDSHEAREAAGAVLMSWRHPSSMLLLPPLLRHPRQEVRWMVARTLQGCGWSPGKETDRITLLVALGDYQGAAMIGAAALDPLTEALCDQTRHDRRKIVQALMLISDARVLKAFILALKDPDPAVRVLAVEALGDIREIQATEALVTALGDEDAHVRVVAVTALGKGGDVNAVPHLVGKLGDPKWDVRKAAVEALSRLHDPQGVEPLTLLLRDNDHDVREAAAKALGELRDPKAIERLVVALCDPQTAARQAAAGALQRIDPQWDKSPAARRAIPALKVALKDREYWVRQSAADVLQRVSAMPVFEPRLGGFSNPLHYRQQAALEALVAGLCDTDRDLRLAAAEALGRIGDQRSIQALSRSLHDADEWVRDACAGSLSLLGWHSDGSGRSTGDVWT
jgi:HEAT repeat protein